MINLLSSPHRNVVEQSMWALGNIAGDGASMRDYVLEKGIDKPLIQLVTVDGNGSFLQNLTWTISNLDVFTLTNINTKIIEGKLSKIFIQKCV